MLVAIACSDVTTIPIPPPPIRLTQAQAEAVASGLAESGVLSRGAETLFDPSGRRVDGLVHCPGGGTLEILNGVITVLDPRELSLTMQTQANMRPSDCTFNVEGGGRISITGDPSLTHTGLLASDSTNLHVDVQEVGELTWRTTELSAACVLNTRTTSSTSLIDTPSAPIMLIEGSVCDVAVRVTVPLYTGIWIR